MSTEYDNIDRIGGTYLDYRNETERLLEIYTHKQYVKCVERLLKLTNMTNRQRVVDLGCSYGAWLEDLKQMGFKEIVGVDISQSRLDQAKERYNETYCCNANHLPFPSNSERCIISNNMLIHVLQDSDKLNVFREIIRVLAPDGVFIFNVGNAYGYGYDSDKTVGHCRFSTPETISNLLRQSGLKITYMTPAFYMVPRVGAHPKFARFSANFMFFVTDKILSLINNTSKAKVLYFATSV